MTAVAIRKTPLVEAYLDGTLICEYYADNDSRNYGEFSVESRVPSGYIELHGVKDIDYKDLCSFMTYDGETFPIRYSMSIKDSVDDVQDTTVYYFSRV